MKLYVNWRTATKAIFKNRKRSLLTMFGIIIGIAAVIAILALGRGFEKDTIQSLTNDDSDEIKVQVYFSPKDQSLYDSNLAFFGGTDLALIKTVAGVQGAAYPEQDRARIYKDIYVKDEKKNKRISLVEKSDQQIMHGRELTLYDQEIQNKVAVIDSITAAELYGSTENALQRGIEIGGQLFNIVGIFEGTEMGMFAMDYPINIEVPEKTYLSYFKDEVDDTSIELTLAEGVTPAEVTENVIKLLEESGTMREFGEYQVFDTSLLTEGVGQILSTITVFISSVAGISLFIAGVGVMNMMYISVSERTKEIGIRRALGATKNSIRLQFLLEGMTLTLVGGIVGYLLGIALAYIVGAVINVSVAIDLFTVMLAVGVSSGIGLVFSVMPASEAAKKDLIDILR